MLDSLLQALLEHSPHLHCQTYFKSSLTALSHAMEDLVLTEAGSPLVIANFQQERFYRQEIRRYRQIALRSNQVYVLAAPESESGFAVASEPYETIPLNPEDGLAQEWHLVIVGETYAACLICREQTKTPASIEQARRFEGIWTFDRQVSTQAARWLLTQIAVSRPELAAKVQQALQQYQLTPEPRGQSSTSVAQTVDAYVFGQRLVTYLQASQYRVLKAYRAIAALERKERLVNSITAAVRCSLEPGAILSMAVQELGQIFADCRCLIYRFQAGDEWVTVEYEAVPANLPALRGESWPLVENPLIQVAAAQDRAIAIADVAKSPLQNNPNLQVIIQHWQIHSWLLVPIRHQGKLLGMIELHHGKTPASPWPENDISLVEAIANQIGVGLTQAHAYADLEMLNRQLTTLDRTQGNLIAIVGHELRTPLSTIQVFLEGVASEPDMPPEFRQEMLDIALSDAERMRKLIQDFLTLSRLESGQVYRCPEAIPLQEAIEIAIGGFQTRSSAVDFPQIKVELPAELPPVKVDAEGLVEALGKLLENACKFTDASGEIVIQARIYDTAGFDHRFPQQKEAAVWNSRKANPMLEVTIADTGRGIESDQLETIFNRFYQAEDSLRRTVGGVGLGLAICRQIIASMGGSIWAESAGKNQGSRFHFTIPIESSHLVQSCVANRR